MALFGGLAHGSAGAVSAQVPLASHCPKLHCAVTVAGAAARPPAVLRLLRLGQVPEQVVLCGMGAEASQLGHDTPSPATVGSPKQGLGLQEPLMTLQPRAWQRACRGPRSSKPALQEVAVHRPSRGVLLQFQLAGCTSMGLPVQSATHFPDPLSRFHCPAMHDAYISGLEAEKPGRQLSTRQLLPCGVVSEHPHSALGSSEGSGSPWQLRSGRGSSREP